MFATVEDSLSKLQGRLEKDILSVVITVQKEKLSYHLNPLTLGTLAKIKFIDLNNQKDLPNLYKNIKLTETGEG